VSYKPTIKPIETVYDGHRFRSRLEARWAVFFKHAGIEYEYEPQGYDMGIEKYLPDFYVSQWKTYLEIKPRWSSNDLKSKEIQKQVLKLKLFSESKPDNEGFILLAGEPYADGTKSRELLDFIVRKGNKRQIALAKTHKYSIMSLDPQNRSMLGSFAECPACKKISINNYGCSFLWAHEGLSMLIHHCCVSVKIPEKQEDVSWFCSIFFSEKLTNAYNAARSERFFQYPSKNDTPKSSHP